MTIKTRIRKHFPRVADCMQLMNPTEPQLRMLNTTAEAVFNRRCHDEKLKRGEVRLEEQMVVIAYEPKSNFDHVPYWEGTFACDVGPA